MWRHWDLSPNTYSAINDFLGEHCDVLVSRFILSRYICVGRAYDLSFNHMARRTIGSLKLGQSFNVDRVVLVFFFQTYFFLWSSWSFYNWSRSGLGSFFSSTACESKSC